MDASPKWLKTASETKKIKYLEENIKSVDLKITEEDFKQIDNILNKHPNVWERYSSR